MQILVRSNDPVRLSFLMALLRDAGITAEILDQQMSAVEGSIGAIPRRLVVDDVEAAQARRVLQEAGEAL
jgi:ABC-type metal ion transport system substrate-binding protein